MRSKQHAARFDLQIDHAEATRSRLIGLECDAKLDFPCRFILIDPVAVGIVLGLETIRAAKLTQWLLLFNEGHFFELAKAAAKDRGDNRSEYDSIPTLEDHLRAKQDQDPRIFEFAKRLLSLNKDGRRKCVLEAWGAPRESEFREFAPNRRGLVNGIHGPTPREDECDPTTHACVIAQALKAIGPTAGVRTASGTDQLERSYKSLWSLAFDKHMPYLWSGVGDAQEAANRIYVEKCVNCIRNEYEYWLSRTAMALNEDNPIVRWLAAPSEVNRLVAISFVIRYVNIRAAKEVAGADGCPPAPPNNWMTVTECAKLFLDDVDGLDLEKAKSRVSWAAGKDKFRTNGKKGNARRIDRDSFSTWRLEQRKRDLDAEDEGPE